MKKRIIRYNIKAPANHLNKIFSKEIKLKTLDKRYNISGKYSDNGGFDIMSTFLYFEPQFNTDSFVKLNLKCVNSNTEGTESLLTLKSLKSRSINTHFWFAIALIVLPIIIVLFQLIINGINESIILLVIPAFGFLYVLLLHFYVDDNSHLVSRIEKMIKAERIDFEKL